MIRMLRCNIQIIVVTMNMVSVLHLICNFHFFVCFKSKQDA